MSSPSKNGSKSGSYEGMREDQEQNLVSEHKSASLSSVGGGLSKPLPHHSNKNFQQLIRDDALTNCFPLADRMRLGLKRAFCCAETDLTFLDELKVCEAGFPAQVSRDYISNVLAHRIIQLTISETSRMQLDSKVVHPFVKIHFVNKDTGCYISKSKDIQSATYHNQNGGYYRDGKWKSCSNDIILPLATTCVDFRLEGNSRGVWNQKFYINQNSEKILTPETIILFQILDFNHQSLIQDKLSEMGRDNFYRVAWAYLRPIGLGKKHLGRNKLQLYRYKLQTRKLPHDYLSNYVPPVYYEFMWPFHQKYQGYLEIDLTLCHRPDYVSTEDMRSPQTIFQRQLGDEGFIKKYAHQIAIQEKQPPIAKYKNLLNYYRINQCKIPDVFVQKFPSAELGCLRLAMTDDILLACCSSSTKTIIKGFNMENMKHAFTLSGHKDNIYSISVSYDQKYFLTVGSDYYAKLWAIPKQTGDFIDEKNSQSYLLAKCIHPSFVYCGCIFQISNDRQLIILTGCYDGLVRLWKVDIQGIGTPVCIQIQINSSDKVYPSCITQGEGFFIVGDSIGGLHIFDIQPGSRLDDMCKKRASLSPKELKDDPIYAIHILNKANIIVQCKDNVIRHFEISTGVPKVVRSYIGSQSQNFRIRSAVSPDKRYIISGSEEGRPVMWDTQTGQIITTDHLQLDIQGPIVDCCWNKKFNLVGLCGYVQQCPIFLYGHKLKETDPQIILALMDKRG